MIHIKKASFEWDVHKSRLFNRWNVYFVPPPVYGTTRPRVWVASFREISHVDVYVSSFEPMPGRMQGASNPYTANAIQEFEAGEIDETQFVETMQVYGALPEQIQDVLDRQDRTIMGDME